MPGRTFWTTRIKKIPPHRLRVKSAHIIEEIEATAETEEIVETDRAETT